jgi:hypothetical protein
MRSVEQVFLRGFPGSQARNFVFENKLLPFEQRDTNVVLVGMGELGPEFVVQSTMFPLKLSDMRTLRHTPTPPFVMPTKASVAHWRASASGIIAAWKTPLTRVDNPCLPG